ncbi:hypothetical protein JRQ81_015210 [Phrynocephalus forsythii]|uniref:DDE-1 domain-containing protein n=1 Tax=Phrynocephalus forsythii TaxID=171643 RepID=A0A9Q0XU41_9SAUR|nr:hypothetical protein JRQ81_015210 [Phrynocephalus forsythii]
MICTKAFHIDLIDQQPETSAPAEEFKASRGWFESLRQDLASTMWVTHILFVQWVNLVFGPVVKQYLLEKNLPFKALLATDNVPVHPLGLEEDLLEELTFIKVIFLPPNTTPLLQPMGQQVISNFKKLYTRELFCWCFEMTDGTTLTLYEYWRDHFDIVSCCVVTPDAFALAPESAVVQEIVSLGRTTRLEVTEEACGGTRTQSEHPGPLGTAVAVSGATTGLIGGGGNE